MRKNPNPNYFRQGGNNKKNTNLHSSLNNNANNFPPINISNNGAKYKLKNCEKENAKLMKIKAMKEKEIEERRKENELEDDIRDNLKCYICLGKVSSPKMCNFCKRIACSACIDRWLQDHTFCGICKHQVTAGDMISIPFLDGMSTFFINKIDNQEKKHLDKYKTTVKSKGPKLIPGQGLMKNNSKNLAHINLMNSPNINININSIDNNLVYNEETSEINDTEENEIDENICSEHGDHIGYYCIQCDKYYCGKCLVFFGEETKKHQNHFIVQASKINDLGVTEAIKEYKKLGETKNKLSELIGRINLLKKEKEIKKYEIINIIDLIRKYNKIKMEEEKVKYQNINSCLRSAKQNLENMNMTLPNELNFVLSQNDINKAQEIFNKLNMMNKNTNLISSQILPQINEQSYQSQNYLIETFKTDYITKKLNISSELNDNCEIINIPINLIPFHTSNLGINYSNGNFKIYLVVNTRDNINSPKYPLFSAYIIFKGLGYSLEFLTMNNEYLEKKLRNENIGNAREQINKVELDKDKFLFLCDNNYKMTFKICLVKLSYK